MKLTTLATLALLTPGLAFAAGSGSSTPPKTTQTASDCKAGEVFDTKTNTCVDSQSKLFDDDTRYEAVRELAYAGQYDRALLVLSSMTEQNSSRVETYRGFIARKQGDMDAAMVHYARALEIDADNILARSYMGQAFVTLGDTASAQTQLTEIRTRGGRNTWAEASLALALKSGKTFSY